MDVEENIADKGDSLPKRRLKALLLITLAHVFIVAFCLLCVVAADYVWPQSMSRDDAVFFFGVLFLPFSLLKLLFDNDVLLAIILSTTSVFWGFIGSRLFVRK